MRHAVEGSVWRDGTDSYAIKVATIESGHLSGIACGELLGCVPQI